MKSELFAGKRGKLFVTDDDVESVSNPTPQTTPLAQTTLVDVSMASTLGRILPTAFGYLPLGFTFGLVALHAGLTPWQAVLMTGLIYAGSSQLLAVNLLGQAAAPWLVILTTFVVNLRHLLMSSALSQRIRHLKPMALVMFCFTLTDEAFALHVANPIRHLSQRTLLVTNGVLYAAFLLGTWAACMLPIDQGTLFRFGLDYAPTAMFIALVVLMVQRPAHVVIALLSGIFSLLCVQCHVGPLGILLATGLAATLGLWSERWQSNPSS